MTPDGHSVLFLTTSSLVDEDTNGASSLYLWKAGPDPAHEANLTLISGEDQVLRSSQHNPLVGMSDDGAVVYYYSFFTSRLMVWSHGSTRVVAADLADNGFYSLRFGLVGAPGSEPGGTRVSPDGRWFAFYKGLFDSDETLIADLQLYDLETGSLFDLGSSLSEPRMTIGNRAGIVLARPTYLTDDGRVFFTPEDSLVPADVNGTFDVYEFDGKTGAVHLLSSGKGREPSEFAAATRDGDDVFFVTRQPLVGSDVDTALDLYDARVSGGFPEPDSAPTPCIDGACQAAAGTPPGQLTAATAAVRGRGNVKRGKRCAPRRQKAARHRAKGHCAKRHPHIRKGRNHKARVGGGGR
jgi:hypothetical protein